MKDHIKELYQQAKKGQSDHVVIEGIHAFKHAARFGADFVEVITNDKLKTIDLMRRIATEQDVAYVEKYAQEVGADIFFDIASSSLRTGIVAIAKKPQYTMGEVQDGQIIFIEEPHDINNVGAVVRVAAAYGAGAVVVTGEISPWHMLAIRAGAGLQWAIPILHVSSLEDVRGLRTVYACDADGVNMRENTLEKNGVFIFGTERDGIRKKTKNTADLIVSIPMQKGVSSMNLATSVSAILYGGTYE